MSTKDRDLELWRQWKRAKTPANLSLLLQQMNGVIQKETNRWSGAIARDVLLTEAEKLAKDAFESYNPNAGAALSTHLTNTLQKLSRTVYSHQNISRLPEYQTLKLQTFNRAHNELEDALGRAPTSAELAERLAWSHAAVEKMRKTVRKENVESLDVGGTPAYGMSETDQMVHLVYHDLNPLHKAVFEHTTGYGGSPILSGAELTKKLKISQGQLSYAKSQIINRIKSVIG